MGLNMTMRQDRTDMLARRMAEALAYIERHSGKPRKLSPAAIATIKAEFDGHTPEELEEFREDLRHDGVTDWATAVPEMMVPRVWRLTPVVEFTALDGIGRRPVYVWRGDPFFNDEVRAYLDDLNVGCPCCGSASSFYTSCDIVEWNRKTDRAYSDTVALEDVVYRTFKGEAVLDLAGFMPTTRSGDWSTLQSTVTLDGRGRITGPLECV